MVEIIELTLMNRLAGIGVAFRTTRLLIAHRRDTPLCLKGYFFSTKSLNSFTGDSFTCAIGD